MISEECPRCGRVIDNVWLDNRLFCTHCRYHFPPDCTEKELATIRIKIKRAIRKAILESYNSISFDNEYKEEYAKEYTKRLLGDKVTEHLIHS